MKQNYYKSTSLLLLCFPLMVTAKNSFFSKEKVEKSVHKAFEVNPNALVEINNSFGDVNIITWENNQVVIDITIKVSGRSQKKIDERLESISIQFQNNPDKVYAKTIIEKNWQWSWFGSYQQTDFEINYDIKMPRNNALELRNDYGAVILDKIDGNTAIHCDYGQVIIGELRGEKNTLSFDYSSNSSIDYINIGTIHADYSGFELGVANRLELKADYTSSKIEKVGHLDFNTDYGKLTVNQAEKVFGNGDYITLRFGSIQKQLDLETDYGSIRIDHIQSTAETIRVKSDYTSVRLGISPQWDFNFDLDLEYAGFKTDLPITYKKEILDNTEKQYLGYHRNEASTNTLTVTADYGSLKILRPDN